MAKIYRIYVSRENDVAVKFLLSARNNDAKRYSLQYVKITTIKKFKELATTDGITLHVVSTDSDIFKDIPDGLYDFMPIKNGYCLEESEGRFQKYDDLDTGKWMKSCSIYCGDNYTKKEQPYSMYVLRALHALGWSCTLSRMEKTAKHFDAWTLYFNDNDRPVKLESEYKCFKCVSLIMPVSPSEIKWEQCNGTAKQ